MISIAIPLAPLVPVVMGLSAQSPETAGREPRTDERPMLAWAWPTRAWPTSSPKDEAIDGTVLEAIDAEIRDGRYRYVDSMLVIRHGRIVFERAYEQDYTAASAGRDLTPHQYNYFHPDWHPFHQGTKLHTMQSVTKSVTSTLIGIAIHRGEIEGTGVPALSFFAEREFPDPDGRKARMTLEDILTMRAGFEWDEWSTSYEDPRNDCIALEAADDWIGFVLAKPMAADPGEVFVYNSGATHLLSGVVAKATGKTIDRYAEEHLFGPLGIKDYHWKRTPSGLPDTEGGLYLKPRDLAKIGLLFLRDGVWEETRLLPEGWVERSVTPWVEDIRPDNGRDDSGYGYKWWILDDGRGESPKVFAAMGFGGQFLFVAPELDLIGVFTGWNIYGGAPSLPALFQSRIVPAAGAG
ncbi:MAG: serine hydrolase [Planctomycetota bacterium]|nr:serine hydrolase [Planctomycetota bacterium]